MHDAVLERRYRAHGDGPLQPEVFHGAFEPARRRGIPYPYTNDWYGFTAWGVQFMPVVFLVMLLATWLFAIAICVSNVIVRKRMQP